MRWANFIALWLLLAVPVVLWLYVRAGRKRARAIEALGDKEILERMSQALSIPRRRFKAGLVIAATLLLAASLARPQVGTGLREVRTSGRDVIFALDVSKSMLAQDIAPSRIQAAKASIAGLLDVMKGDRVGLVIFAGDAFLQCPLTVDYSAMRLLLDTVNIGSVPRGGTNITDAIKEAVKTFSMAESRSRIIVLITDGEDHSGKALDAAKDAAKDNIQIYTVGIGREGDAAPIPIKKEDGGVAYMKDREGKTVMSRLDEETLQKISLETGGKYYFGGQRLDLIKVYNQVAQKKGSGLVEDRFYIHYEDRYQWLLIPALLLLFIEAIVSERRRKISAAITRQASPMRKVASILLVLPFLMAFGGTVVQGVKDGNRLYTQGKYGEALARYAEAQGMAPEDPRINYNIGNALYQQGKYKEALEAYQKVLNAQDRNLKQQTYYNMGNCFTKQGAAASDMKLLNQAVQSYEKALEFKPDDQDAKYNLEVVRKMIEIKKKEQEQQQQKQKQEQQQQQQKQKQQNQQDQKNQQNQKENQDEKKNEQKESPAATQEQQAKPAQATTEEQQVPQASEKKEMSREQAEQILRALEDKERENLEERRQPTTGSPSEVYKDW